MIGENDTLVMSSECLSVLNEFSKNNQDSSGGDRYNAVESKQFYQNIQKYLPY